MGQQTQVRFGLLQLNLSNGRRVLRHWSIVGVGVEDTVTIWARGTRVGHTDGPGGGAGRARVVLLPTRRDGDGQGPHSCFTVCRGFFSGWRNKGGRRREFIFWFCYQGLEIDTDIGAGKPQRTTEKKVQLMIN